MHSPHPPDIYQTGRAAHTACRILGRMPHRVKKEIAVLDGDQATANELCSLLVGEPYSVMVMDTLRRCEDYLRENLCAALILDLDTVAVDNRSIARLKRHHPTMHIIAKSDRSFHPELEASLRSHIFACLAKPLDPDELGFLLKSLLPEKEP